MRIDIPDDSGTHSSWLNRPAQAPKPLSSGRGKNRFDKQSALCRTGRTGEGTNDVTGLPARDHGGEKCLDCPKVR